MFFILFDLVMPILKFNLSIYNYNWISCFTLLLSLHFVNVMIFVKAYDPYTFCFSEERHMVPYLNKVIHEAVYSITSSLELHSSSRGIWWEVTFFVTFCSLVIVVYIYIDQIWTSTHTTWLNDYQRTGPFQQLIPLKVGAGQNAAQSRDKDEEDEEKSEEKDVSVVEESVLGEKDEDNKEDGDDTMEGLLHKKADAKETSLTNEKCVIGDQVPDKGKDDHDHQDDQGDKDDEDDIRNVPFPTKNHDKEAASRVPEKDKDGDNTDVCDDVDDTRPVLVHEQKSDEENRYIPRVNGNTDDVGHVEVKEDREKDTISPITPIPAKGVMVQSNTHTSSNKTCIRKEIPKPALKLIAQTRPRIEVASLTPDQKASVKLVAQRYKSLAEFVPWFPRPNLDSVKFRCPLPHRGTVTCAIEIDSLTTEQSLQVKQIGEQMRWLSESGFWPRRKVSPRRGCWGSFQDFLDTPAEDIVSQESIVWFVFMVGRYGARHRNPKKRKTLMTMVRQYFS